MFIVIAIHNQGLDMVEKFSELGEAIEYANHQLDNFIDWTNCDDYDYATEDNWFAYGNTDKYDYSIYIIEL